MHEGNLTVIDIKAFTCEKTTFLVSMANKIFLIFGIFCQTWHHRLDRVGN